MSVAGNNKREMFQRELATLFEQYHPMMYKAAYSVTKRHQDAEDVLQTVFLRLIEEEQPSTDFLSNPSGYLYRAAMNAALDVVRVRARRKVTDDDVNSLEIPAAAADPDREVLIARMEAALAKLKPDHIKVLHLRYRAELTCRKIAKMLRRSDGAIVMELLRARAEIKRLMEIKEGL